MARTRKKKSKADNFLLDFTNVEQGGGRFRVRPGFYRVKIEKAVWGESPQAKTPQLELSLTITDGKHKGKKFKEQLYRTPKAMGRFMTLLEAVGEEVGPKSKIDPDDFVEMIVGERIYVELKDEESDEYDTRSRVDFNGFYSEEDYEDRDEDDEDDEDDDDSDDEEESDDDDEDEEEEDDDEDEENYDDMSVKELRAELDDRDLPTKGKKAALIARLEEDDESDDEEEDEEPEEKPKKKRRKKKAADDDEDLDLDEY